MAKETDEDQNTWKTLLDVLRMITVICKRILPTDFKYDKLVSLLNTLIKDVRIVLISAAVTLWPDAVNGKHVGCVYFLI